MSTTIGAAMYRNYVRAEKILTTVFKNVRNEHSALGHEFIWTHWKRYINQIMRLPEITSEWHVLEIGASIMSDVIKETFNASMETVYHELEPEWKERFESAGITSYPVELLRDPLPVPDGVFDLILLDEVLEHFPVAPGYFLRQCIAKLKPDGQLMLSVPNFATSQKRLRLLLGKNPQDPMDEKYIYYAHHREPVMTECIDLVNECGGYVEEYEWSDFDTASDALSVSWHMLRCIKHGMFHRIIHQIVPSMRSYLFLRVKKKTTFKPDESAMIPPLSVSGEYGTFSNM